MPQLLETTGNALVDLAGIAGGPNPAPNPGSRVSMTRQGVRFTKFDTVCPLNGNTAANPVSRHTSRWDFEMTLPETWRQNIAVRKQACFVPSPYLFGKDRGHVTLV